MCIFQRCGRRSKRRAMRKVCTTFHYVSDSGAIYIFPNETHSNVSIAANRWFKLAAADGDANGSVRAQTALGHWYADRHHLDLPSAFAWHSCAARNGSIQSLCRLPLTSSFSLFFSSSSFSDTIAQCCKVLFFFWFWSLAALGVMYQHGLGVEPDEDQAFKCFRGAAERGSLYASANLVALFYKRKLYKRAFDLSAQCAPLSCKFSYRKTRT